MNDTIRKVQSLLDQATALLKTVEPLDTAALASPCLCFDHPEPIHSEDFGVIYHGRDRWKLTLIQHEAVRCLWEAWERQRPEVDSGAILRYVVSRADFTADVTEDEETLFTFLDSNPTLIQRTGYGVYRLAFPMASEQEEKEYAA